MSETATPADRSRIVRVLISGRVQGVGYRAWTARAARKAGLSGWVRNLADGRVEALFRGSADTVESMLARCRKGPTFARVDHLDVGEAEEDGNMIGADPFEIRPDGDL